MRPSRAVLPTVLLVLLLLPLLAQCAEKTANAIERERNIYISVLFPRVFDAIMTVGLETPVQIRGFFYLNLAHYNAWVNYHPTAVDIFGRAPHRRPAAEHTVENKNIAGLYAIYRVYVASPHSFGGPAGLPEFRKIFAERDLDPDDTRTSGGDAVAAGNRAGFDTARLVLNDGWNAEGKETVSEPNYRLPFQDTSGYYPVNAPGPGTAAFPLRWAPLLESDSKGKLLRQDHVTPQAAHAVTFSLSRADVAARRVKLPYERIDAARGNVSKRDFDVLRKGAEAVLRTSRGLTVEQRVLAELFDNKVFAFRNAQNPVGVLSIAAALRFAILNNALDWNYDEELLYGVAANIVSYDATVLVWKEKLRLDAVRPTGDTMRYVFGDARKTVWGGPGKGPRRIRAGAWQSYIRTMPHSEFPSASACLCTAVAEHALLFTGGKEDLPFNVSVPQGSSAFYPGREPSRNVTVEIKTISEWGSLCGASRLYAGVHFPEAIPAGEKLCTNLARKTQDVVDSMIAGTFKAPWKYDLPEKLAKSM